MASRAEQLVAAVIAVVLGGNASAGPHMPEAPDLFDHLATTFPIADWVKHARNRYDAWEARRPLEHPLVEFRVLNWIEISPEYTRDRSVAAKSARESLTAGHRFGIVPDPCRIAMDPTEAGRSLPDDLGMSGVFAVLPPVVNADFSGP